MKAGRFVSSALVFTAMLIVAGCNRESGKTAGKAGGPRPGATGGPPGKPSPIQAIMARLTKGPQSLTMVIGDELKESSPPWDQLQAQTKEFVELAGSMGKHEPPKGSKESWSKLTAAYSDSAVALEKAVQGKDKDAAIAAHQTLSSSCMACHKQHRGRP